MAFVSRVTNIVFPLTLLTVCLYERRVIVPHQKKDGASLVSNLPETSSLFAARMALQPFDLPTSTRSAKPGSMAPFGSKVPLAEPSWYQNLNTPYYNASHVAWRAKLRDFFEKEVEPSE